MDSKYDGNILAVRMYTGEDLVESLAGAFENIAAPMGILVSAAGMIKNAKYGYFEGAGRYSYNSFDEPREIVSLTGNLVRSDSRTYRHLHVAVAGSDGIVNGGHLESALVHGTAEIFIVASRIEAKREKEEETGLEGLRL